MLKFLLIHSYSDFNKGDAAIIIATIQNLRNSYPNCKIELQSTYSSDDPCFHAEHLEIKKYVDEIHSCLFPQLFLKTKRDIKYDTFSKAISLFKYSIKNVINYCSLKLSGHLLLGNAKERASLEAIKNSDVIISKGGSFLCSDGSIRGDISLFRLFHPFMIAKIFNKKTVVFSQSLGPCDSKFSKMIFNYCIKYIDMFYVRELETLNLLNRSGIYIPQDKLEFCPDVAFTLDSAKGKKIIEIDKDKLNIGITIVDFNFATLVSKEKYITALRSIFATVTEQYKVHFYIFPQVINKHPEFGTEDMRLAKDIITSVENKSNITLIEGNYECIDLAETYADMDIFIATRLHSSIFAMSKGVPAINIAYHGTKSEGTFKLMGCSEYVFKISEVNPEFLVNKVLELIQNRELIRERIEESLEEIQNNIKKAVCSIA